LVLLLIFNFYHNPSTPRKINVQFYEKDKLKRKEIQHQPQMGASKPSGKKLPSRKLNNIRSQVQTPLGAEI